MTDKKPAAKPATKNAKATPAAKPIKAAEPAPKPSPSPKPKAPSVTLGQVVTYHDRMGGGIRDARVSGIVNEEAGVVDLAVFSRSGRGGVRPLANVSRGLGPGCWSAKEA